MKNIFENIERHIALLDSSSISAERKSTLNLLVEYLKNKQANNEITRLNFICTHNSRRSHLTQIWAQTMAYYFNVKNVNCYSAGTEATAVFPMVIETLRKTGFKIKKLSENNNPIYSIKYTDNEAAIIGFSKELDHEFNPKSKFAAIMTCSQADEDCPFVLGAEARIPLPFVDPKAFDDSELQSEKYLERSTNIASELFYVFSQLNP
jgi:arsenate reductase